MAVAIYNTDLSTITLCEAGETYEEFVGYALGDNAAVETDWYLQGSACASDEANNKTGVGHSIGKDYGSSVSFSAGDCFFAWMMCMAGNAVDTFVNGGYRVLIGPSTTNFDGWAVGGRDFGRNPYGGWTNVVVDPTHAADYTGGTGGTGTYQHFGIAFKMTSGISKGRPNCADAMRYGRGDLYVEHGQAAAYGTFTAMATTNDASAAKWGLFQAEGTGYLWKGLMSLGTVANAVDFRDSNVNITIDNTPRTYTDFNKIEIVNASSNVEWTGVNITSLDASGLSIGCLEMMNDATFKVDNCVFTDMDTFIFDSNATLTNTTFRRCGQVNQEGADIDDCIFDNSTAAVSLLVDNLDNIDNCDFYSDGSNHAIELTPDHAGGSYTLTGCTFTDYAAGDGSTGNECIFNDSTGHVNISVGTAQIPTIRNGPGASTTVTGSVTLYILVKDEDGVPIQNVQTSVHKTSDRSELVNQDTDVNGEVDTSYSGATPVAVEVRCRKASVGATKYINYSSLQSIVAVTGLSLSITLKEDPNNNATS